MKEDGHRVIGSCLPALKESIWAILTPVIVLGGIYAGIFTPTEAAVVAVFYSLFVPSWCTAPSP